MHLRGDVGVGVQRKAGVGVSEDAGQSLGVHAAAHGVGGEGVAQIMEADVRQAGFLEDQLQTLVGGARRDGLLRLQNAGEDPLAHGRLPPFLEDVQGAGGEQDRAGPLLGLRFAHHHRAAGSRMDGAAYPQRSRRLVEVAPFEAADLAPAKAGGDLRVEEIVPQGLGPDRLHEFFQLLLVENLLGSPVELRDHRAFGGVLHDQSGVHCRLHDLVEQHVDAADRDLREMPLGPIGGVVGLLSQGVIELLHVPLGDGAEHLLSQSRDDMMPGVAAVAADGTLPQDGLGVGREPALNPFRHRHVPFLAQVRSPVAVDGAVELRHQLLLGPGEDGFEDGRPVLLVADDDAAFPAAVPALADEAVAVRSFS